MSIYSITTPTGERLTKLASALAPLIGEAAALKQQLDDLTTPGTGFSAGDAKFLLETGVGALIQIIRVDQSAGGQAGSITTGQEYTADSGVKKGRGLAQYDQGSVCTLVMRITAGGGFAVGDALTVTETGNTAEVDFIGSTEADATLPDIKDASNKTDGELKVGAALGDGAAIYDALATINTSLAALVDEVEALHQGSVT